ncbi:MAG: hypothetical protein AB4352_18445 [Hormoscilla sp.]
MDPVPTTGDATTAIRKGRLTPQVQQIFIARAWSTISVKIALLTPDRLSTLGTHNREGKRTVIRRSRYRSGVLTGDPWKCRTGGCGRSRAVKPPVQMRVSYKQPAQA